MQARLVLLDNNLAKEQKVVAKEIGQNESGSNKARMSPRPSISAGPRCARLRVVAPSSAPGSDLLPSQPLTSLSLVAFHLSLSVLATTTYTEPRRTNENS